MEPGKRDGKFLFKQVPNFHGQVVKQEDRWAWEMILRTKTPTKVACPSTQKVKGIV